MRRALGYILIALGVFLFVLGPTVRWVVAPRLAVAPLECTPNPGYEDLCDNGVSLSPSSGVATSLFSAATLSVRTDVPLEANRRVRPDRATSTADQTIYATIQEVLDGDGKLVTASEATFGFDGHTSALLDCCNANVDGEAITDFGGVMPLKFGFGVEKKDYNYFDTTLQAATPAVYTGTDQIDGVDVYVFEQVIEPTQIGTLEVPGDLVGTKEASFVAPRYYSNTRTLYVEPTTGVIVNGTEQQLQTLRGPDGTDQLTIIEATLGFTEANQANAAVNASDGKSKLGLISTTVPLIALLLGLVLAAFGAFLVVGSRPEETDGDLVR
jgi:hypothetical protein